ncbi:PAXNEB protein-domain-containing protein [Durotheca rogersii]|uniref:PAXNEB protein-domain-containing protein n=1 Tax=Durotheca rogersii TaxID=419775 RepID=UPI00221EF5BE|nr:PAXNEB protein-domain-containing protein [Durotheca rogersii]KAI5866462.1 PAXNEB protein-domain-containing protein [Durotheca rogersii]
MSARLDSPRTSASSSSQPAQPRTESLPAPGVRPSPVDGRLTTSTGTASLDGLLAGHAGLPLGTSLLIGEHGTTDFAGVLLRYYAAEGMVQGHQVHVLGPYDSWRHELPGLSIQEKSESGQSEAPSNDKMKIAWRYESLTSAGAPRDREILQRQNGRSTGNMSTFCHSFDLSKRLNPKDAKGQIGFHPSMSGFQSLPSPTRRESPSPFKTFIKDVDSKLGSSPPSWIHRIVVPGLLSPTTYDGSSARPEEVLQFLHALRALLRQYPARLTVVIALPLSLYPRTTGLTRWMEILCDGVVELIPLQSGVIHVPPPSSKSDSKPDEQMQGLLKVHSLPLFHERGGGSSENNSAGEDLSFSLSRSRGLVIKPFYLPPVGEDEGGKSKSEPGKGTSAGAGPGSRSRVRISKVAGQYLLFDIDDVMYLRRHHNICSVFVGTIPQNSQQNIFMGLPVELMPEEARVLVDKRVAFVVDDASFHHPSRLAQALDTEARRLYLQAIKAEGKRAQLAAAESKARSKPPPGEGRIGKRAKGKKAKQKEEAERNDGEAGRDGTEKDVSLYEPPGSASPSSGAQAAKPAKEPPGFAVTPTTSSLLYPRPQPGEPASADIDLPPSYPLYAHLQAQGYYLMPGLRFGCDYNVYPGDPLRFHSHFQATGYGWDAPVRVLDIVAGGRLGTGVKKGYLIGGATAPPPGGDGGGAANGKGGGGEEAVEQSPAAPHARVFCIEWAAM